MIRLVAFFLAYITSIVASTDNMDLQWETVKVCRPIYSEVAVQEFCDGKPSQATCVVICSPLTGEEFPRGSGVLCSLGSHVFVLTAAHNGITRRVCFSPPYNDAKIIDLNTLYFEVSRSFSLAKETGSSFAQDDIQILLLDGNPERQIKPLVLSSEIDTAKPLTVYGFGTYVAEFDTGKISAELGGIVYLDENNNPQITGHAPAKIVCPNYRVNPISTWSDRVISKWSQFLKKFVPAVSVTKVNPKTKVADGIIAATTTYDPENLETHIGAGFSGGPVLQNDKIVGITQGSNLFSRVQFIKKFKTFMRYQFLIGVVLYAAGKVKLNTAAVFVVQTLFAEHIKIWAPQTLQKVSGKVTCVHITPDIIRWIQSKLEGSEPKLNTAS